MRCPEDAAEMTGFSSVGFGTSSRHLIEEEEGKEGCGQKKRDGVVTVPYRSEFIFA